MDPERYDASIHWTMGEEETLGCPPPLSSLWTGMLEWNTAWNGWPIFFRKLFCTIF